MKKAIILILLSIILISAANAKTGSMKLLAVSNEETNPTGSIADLYLEIKEGSGRVFIDSFPLSKLDTQISTRFAKEVACNFLERDCSNYDFFYTIRANSPIVGGPSASAAITILTIAVLEDLQVDEGATITGTINTGGIIGPVGGILPKIEAASSIGLKKVLIPKYSGLNESNITDYESKNGIKVVEVSQLSEAIKEMTGKEYGNNGEFMQAKFYVETMEKVSGELCERAKGLLNEVFKGEKNLSNITAGELYNKGISSIEKDDFYSAASYCFGSGLHSQNKKIQEQKLTEKQIKERIDEYLKRISEFKNHTEKSELKTITDLEAYMVVNDRLVEAKEKLLDALFQLATNKTNASLYNLAYGIERLNSAISWSAFFGKPGRAFDINKNVLDASCLKKISEVEERIQYIELYLPTGTDEARQSVRKANEDYNAGNPELCLYKASIAKAKINLILNNVAIGYDELDKVIEDRGQIVTSIISKQAGREIFPILGYSYYEYANSLKETDKYSALLYLEYAIELANLDIYFEKRKIALPRFSNEHLILFLSGVFVGVVTGVIMMKVGRKPAQDAKRKK